MAMNLDAFRSSTDRAAPPQGLSDALEALWYASKGDWDRAHEITQVAGERGDGAADWVHAYLHRVEGDAANAAYWYRRSGRPVATGSLESEWDAIVSALLEQL